MHTHTQDPTPATHHYRGWHDWDPGHQLCWSSCFPPPCASLSSALKPKQGKNQKQLTPDFLRAWTRINREYCCIHHESLGSDKHKVLLSILSGTGKHLNLYKSGNGRTRCNFTLEFMENPRLPGAFWQALHNGVMICSKPWESLLLSTLNHSWSRNLSFQSITGISVFKHQTKVSQQQ